MSIAVYTLTFFFFCSESKWHLFCIQKIFYLLFFCGEKSIVIKLQNYYNLSNNLPFRPSCSLVCLFNWFSVHLSFPEGYREARVENGEIYLNWIAVLYYIGEDSSSFWSIFFAHCPRNFAMIQNWARNPKHWRLKCRNYRQTVTTSRYDLFYPLVLVFFSLKVGRHDSSVDRACNSWSEGRGFDTLACSLLFGLVSV